MLLEGADDIDWAALDRAYHSPDDDIAGILRALASTDPATADRALETIIGWTLHQGTVYSTSAAVVPFMLEAATVAVHGRARIVEWVGVLADPDWGSNPDAGDQVRAELIRHGGRLVGLLGDPDPRVRSAAAYAASRVHEPASPPPLRRRWSVEHSAEVGQHVLIALAAHKPEAMADQLGRILMTGSAWHRLAAAYAIHRARLPWPAGSAAALVGAIEAGAGLAEPWVRSGDALDEIIGADGDDEFVAEVVRLAMRSTADPVDATPVWRSATYGLEGRCKRRRGAPERLLPLLGPLLDSPDPERRHVATMRLHSCGRTAGRFADRLAAIAAGLPEAMSGDLRNEQFWATETLIRLGDPRGMAPAVAAWSTGKWLFQPETRVFGPVGPRLLAEVGRHLDAAGARGDRRAVVKLASFAAGIGHAAAPLGPRLRAVRAVAEPEVVAALIATGVATDDEVRWVVDNPAPQSPGRAMGAAVELFRRTGRPEPVHAVLDRHVADRHGAADVLRTMLPVAGQLPPLGGALDILADSGRPSVVGILAAHVLVRNGGPAPSREAMWDALTAEDTVARPAAELAADLPEIDLDSALRLLLDNSWTRYAAAEALIARGAPPDEFGDVFECWLRCEYTITSTALMPLCTRFATPTMLARLRELVAADERLIRGGEVSTIIWEDEAAREALRFAVTVLAAPAA